MRGLIYVRVSTDEQAEKGFSLAAQEEMCRERAIMDSCASIDVFVDDGYSAATLDRPALQRLLQIIRRGDTIYVYRLDRLSRDVEHMAVLLKSFQAKEVRISPIVGSADVSTSLGRAFTNMQAVWAQLEREQLGERVSMGMRKRVAEGKPYSRVPHGLKAVNDTWTIDDAEAAAIRLSFSLRADGYGIATICRRLSEAGYLTRQGRLWNGRAVWHILQNPAYVGNLVYRDVVQDGVIPPIVSREVWDKVQAVNKVRRRSRVRTESRYLLSGLVCCSCGRTMGGYIQRPAKRKDGSYTTYPTYRCIGRSSTPATDHNNAVGMRKLDELVIQHILGLRKSRTVNITYPPIKQKKDDHKLDDLMTQLENLEVLLLQGRITGDRYDFHKDRLQREIEAEKKELESSTDTIDASREYRRKLLDSVPDDLLDRYRNEGATPKLKSIMHALIERIEVSLPDGKKRGLDSRVIRIHLRPLQ